MAVGGLPDERKLSRKHGFLPMGGCLVVALLGCAVDMPNIASKGCPCAAGYREVVRTDPATGAQRCECTQGDEPEPSCLEGGTEVCGNLADENCNGVVDEGCRSNCMDDKEGYGNCNMDFGYGDACGAADNFADCEEYWFWGWCNRRKDPQIWIDAMRRWTAEHCDGSVVYEEASETFTCTATDGRTYECVTPLVLSTGDGPIDFEPGDAFDLTATGKRLAYDRPKAPWLAWDRNVNGKVDDGSELVGSATPMGSGKRARDGMEALGALDVNGDGWVDGRDPGWEALLVWEPGSGSMTPLSGRVDGIELRSVPTKRCDARGNCEAGRAPAVLAGGGRGWVVDVYLARPR